MPSVGSIVLKRKAEPMLIFELANGFGFNENETEFEILDAKGNSICKAEIKEDKSQAERLTSFGFPIDNVDIKGKFELIVRSTIPAENFLIQLTNGRPNYLQAVLF